MNHVRAELNLVTFQDINSLVSNLNSDGTIDKYILENEFGNLSVEARSLLGVTYAASAFNKIYLVNLTNDGVFPSSIDNLRS